MCKEAHVPTGACGLGIRPPKHLMARASAGPWITSDALSQFFLGRAPRAQFSEKLKNYTALCF
jgi:hypothetical protein